MDKHVARHGVPGDMLIFPRVRGGFRESGAGPVRPSAKIQADGQHTFSFLPGSPATMESPGRSVRTRRARAVDHQTAPLLAGRDVATAAPAAGTGRGDPQV